MAATVGVRSGRPAVAKGKKSSEAMVRIEADAARLAKIVASFEDRSIGEIISEIVTPVLKRRYEEHVKRAQSEIAKESTPKKPER